MKRKILVFACVFVFAALAFCGCGSSSEIEEEINPGEFSYEMLDISIVVDEIYDSLEISEYT